MAEYIRTYEKPTAPPYPGWRWVFHRLSKSAEYMMGFITTPFGPHEYVMMPEAHAEWFKDHKGKAKEFPARQDHPDPEVRSRYIEYRLVLDGDPMFGVPIEMGEHEEYLSREGQPMYLQRGIDVKTTPKLIKVGESTGALPFTTNAAPPTAHPTADVVTLAKQMAQQMMEEFVKAQPPIQRMSGRRPPRRRSRTVAPVVGNPQAVPTDP